jgi:hypothetical protein
VGRIVWRGGRVKNGLERFKMEEDLKWREIARTMPFFTVPEGYQIAVIPPFAGAEARFRVKRPDGEEISVYADFYNSLGYFGGPHWEVYPDKDDNNSRVPIDDVKGLWDLIIGK